ncbi:DUF2119 domain-containing protein [Methanobrevibacter sp.]|uniref:DUF2119 domain-containing protein n=1 Tax=Methanobrevibacter sp. TaxID=66852 RepID=UPI0026DEDA45|nr:DUF2119 domain-containing protein [Methanobrevibacter sp.]MDO5823654.1 DUF2119 domain-containing protein [Methanobrevibacter sp.]
MSYFQYIDNGEGPVKLFIGGLHGNEGKTSLKFIKRIKDEDLSCGQFYFYNFDKTPYVSTIKKEFYSTKIGKKVLELIRDLKPDFYTELHCYDLKNYNKLISIERYEKTGIPPLIKLGNHVLVSSVSPLIRMTYFSAETVCKTLEFPCFEKLNPEIAGRYDFNMARAIETYEELLKLILKSSSRQDFERKMMIRYSEQVHLAMEYAQKVFGKDFPPY